MARRASMGAPARLALLLLSALIACIAYVAAAPPACPVSANGTNCVGCAKKSCKFDDNCHFNQQGQAKRGICQDLSNGLVVASTGPLADKCSGVQRKHGKNVDAAVGGPGKKKARCSTKSVTAPGFSTTSCVCVNKKGNNLNNKGNPVKKCKRCQQSEPLRRVNNTPPPPASPPPPPAPPSPPPPPPINGTFLPNNLMTMQGGAVTYTPSTKDGNWTTLCEIPAQARAVAYGASLETATGTETADAAWLVALWTGSSAIEIPGLSALTGKSSYSTGIINEPFYMSGTKYFDAATSWYKDGLPQTSAGKSNGGLAPSSYVGNGKDFLDNYFRSGIQTGGSGTMAPSGSKSNAANQQILEKTSAYWVAVTHIQYNLDMAEINLASNKTAEAKANYDAVAAAYFGCGDTNPVPLPKYKGTQITYSTTASSPDTGSNATTMSVYGVANKRADNYGTAKAVPGKTASTTSPTTTKVVAELNLDVGVALNAAPTAANVQIIRDATNTIFAQAAQRYIAKITLGAHLPGNGMGGSTNSGTAISAPTSNPTTGYWAVSGASGWGIWNSADGTQATACGGESSQIQHLAVGDDTTQNTLSLQMNGGLACSKLTSGAGTTASNTAVFRTVNPEVKIGASDSLPYTVAVTETYATDDVLKNGGLTEAQILRATRGAPQTTGSTPAKTSTPTACIGASVLFNEVINSGAANGVVDTTNGLKPSKGIALCDPAGLLPEDCGTCNGVEPASTRTLQENILYYSGAASGTNGAKVTQLAFWDPITAAQASGGAFCCDALYYGKDGMGRGNPANDPPIVGVTKNADFTPTPFVGSNMNTQTSPGGVCTDGDATSKVKEGLSKALNVKEKEMLEGQAFFACVAPSQYNLPVVSTGTTQTINAAKQQVCARTLTKMLKMNQEDAGTSTDNAACKADAIVLAGNPGTAASPGSCTGTGYSAIEYPLWYVGIGSGTGLAEYAVPNGYCYANACLEDFAAVGTSTAFNGPAKLAALVKGPDMSSNPSTETNACGRANNACKAAPPNWSGGEVVFKSCTKVAGDASSCTAAETAAQTGTFPTV